MKTVWKFPLVVSFKRTLMLPIGARVLCVKTQNNLLQLYALVDTEQSVESRTFLTFGTGDNIGTNDRYIGTYMINEESEVYHVFEEGKS